MEILLLSKAFTLIEPGPVVLVTTNDGQKDNVMTITWTMVIGFSAPFAITTEPWNHSYAALLETKECEKFGLTPVKARYVRAPLIKECLANIECRVVDIIDRHSIVVLEGVAAYFDSAREEKRMIHAVGNGAFIVDGGKIDRKEMMRSKLPSGL